MAPVAAPAAPDFPTRLDPAGISAWLTAATDLRPDQVVALSPSVVTAVLAREPEPAGAVELLLRAEALTPEAAARGGVLAWEVRLQADCRRGLVQLDATRGYGGRRPDGPGVEMAPAEGRWRRPAPSTTLHAAWRAACDPSFQPPLAPTLVTASQSVLPEAPHRPPQPSIPPAAPPKAPAAPEVVRAAVDRAPATPRRQGTGAVQVVSSPKAEDSRSALVRMRGRFAEAFGGLDTRVEPAQVRGRTVYRGMVVGFASRGEAQSFCETLKRGRQDCLAR